MAQAQGGLAWGCAWEAALPLGGDVSTGCIMANIADVPGAGKEAKCWLQRQVGGTWVVFLGSFRKTQRDCGEAWH